MERIPLDQIRRIRIWEHGKEEGLLHGLNEKNKKISLLDLASNDYLSLSTNPKLVEAANLAMVSQGVGAGGSRFITGSRPIHKKLENALGEWLNREHVLLFPSGFQANLAAVIALANRNTLILADKLIHHSLLVGIHASGAKFKRFAHNDLNELQKYLTLSHGQKVLVITESLFSMQGTSPDLEKVCLLCKKYNANLLVDEAHALGVMGYQGRGLCYGLSDQVSLISGTFGKAFGSGGAFLASNKFIGEDLVQKSGAFRYTTALAPPLAAAALEALKIIQQNPSWGEELQLEAKRWRNQINTQGWDYPPGEGPIISIVIGSNKQSLAYQKKLEQNGLLCVAIRPPTVPEGTSRLRIVVRRNLPKNTLQKLTSSLAKQ